MTDKLIEQIKAGAKRDKNAVSEKYVDDLENRILADAEALKAADELAVLALNTGCATQEDADRLRDKVAAYNAKRGDRK